MLEIGFTNVRNKAEQLAEYNFSVCLLALCDVVALIAIPLSVHWSHAGLGIGLVSSWLELGIEVLKCM